MSLFKELERLVNNQDLTLHISKSEEKLIVTILPKPKVNDEAKTKLVPITLKGSAEELDKEALPKLSELLQETDSISNNLAEFEKSKEKFEKENSAKKEIEDKKKKELEKAIKDLEKVDEYIEKKDFDKAEFLINTLLKIDENNKKAKEAKEKLEKAKPNQVSMFDVIEEVEQEKQTLPPNSLQQVDPITEENVGKNENNFEEDFSLTEEYEDIPQINEPFEEESDEEIKDALIQFDIEQQANNDDGFDPFEEEREYWAKREYEKQQQQQQKPSFIK